MTLGDTFLIPGIDDHLWIVISDPSIEPERIVIVCLLTYQERYDQSCILKAGEHPFIKHATCVNFPGARIESDELLERLKRDGTLKLKERAEQALLAKIHAALEASDIPTEAFAILREQGFTGI